MRACQLHNVFTVEWLAPISFSSERLQAAQFVSNLHISPTSFVPSFSFLTHAKVVIRAWSVSTLMSPTTRWGVSANLATLNQGAADRTTRVPTRWCSGGVCCQGTLGSKDKGQHGGVYQEYPISPQCERQHPSACQRATLACITCGKRGHRAGVTPQFLFT